MHLKLNWVLLDECTILWGKPDRVHVQNMEQLQHLTLIRMWLYLRSQNITKKSIHVYTGTTSQASYNTQDMHAAHRLVQHMLQVVEMAWAGDSTLTIFFTCATGSLYCAVVLKRYDFNTGTVSQAAKTNSIDRLPCGYLYCCSHWIGKSLNGLHPCCRHRGDRLSIVHVFNSQVVFELMHDIKHASKSQKWLTALHMKIFNCAPASEICWFKIFGKWFIFFVTKNKN